MTYQEVVLGQDTVVVDVRTVAEFDAGHADGSINIPLHLIPLQIDYFRSLQVPVVLCCATGARSGQACIYLVSQGITDCYNGGAWQSVAAMREGHDQIHS